MPILRLNINRQVVGRYLNKISIEEALNLNVKMFTKPFFRLNCYTPI